MRILNLLVFDEIISGTTSTWYSREDLNRILGMAEAFAVQAYVTNVSGTFPALTVASQHSSDGQNWAATNATEINAILFVEGGTYAGTSGAFLVPGAHLRFKITLGGTAPHCRLKLYFTGRGHGADASAGAGAPLTAARTPPTGATPPGKGPTLSAGGKA